MAGRGGMTGWDGWMMAPTQRTWVWASSGSWWWTGKPGVLQSMGLQRVGHDWVTELNWNSSLYSQGYDLPSSHVCMWDLDPKESWVPKNWCFISVVLEKTLESPLDWKKIQPVNPKENQSWIFTGRTDTEAETPLPWPLDVKNWLIWKDPDAGKDWRWKEKGKTENEMVGWHHRLDGHEFE